MLKKIARTKRFKDIVSFISFTVLLILFFIFSGTKYIQINTNFWSNNNFASPNETLFTSANRNIFNIEYRYLAVTILLILVIKFGYKIYQYHKKDDQKYINDLDSNLNSMIYSVLVVFICLMTGLQDISTIVLVLVSSFVGLKLISSNKKEKIDGLGSLKIVGILLTLVSWLLIIVYSLGTIVYGNVRSTWYVYVLDLIGLAYFIFLVIDMPRYIGKFKRGNQEFIKYCLDLLLKVGFFIVLLIGIN
ncbi:MAG TPA: hypothetical protein VMV24_01225 [Candidatus Dormibacteraeota bacterium]|nr:hypothetical protein [Candidatus Dormibacteraeota bacterium]